MSAFWHLLLVLGVGLEIALLWRIHKCGMWRHYPFFAAYLLFVLLRTLVLLAVMRLYPEGYAPLYWRSEIPSVFLRFLVAWEVFRHSFPRTSALYRVVLRAIITALFVLAIALFINTAKPGMALLGRSVYPGVERSLGFAQAISLLMILLIARYYRVPLGRNVLGMAVGLGMYVSISVANFAAFELLDSFVPYWRLVRPTSFVAMLAIWTCTLWVYAPNPSLSRGEISVSHMKQWGEAWNRTLSILRRVINP